MPTTVPDSHRDLLSAPIASLTTLGRNGGPQSTLIWFVYDEADGRFKTSLSDDRAKTKHLMARPQASLLVLDPNSPMRYLDVRGTATLEVDTDAAWARTHIAAKYDGADVRDHDGPDSVRYVVTIEPTSIYTADLNA